MSPVFGPRKRAEEFHALLEESHSASAPDDAVEARFTDLLSTVATLRQVGPTPARPDFVADLRAKLMLAADTALAPAESPAPVSTTRAVTRHSKRERRITAAVGGFAIVSATASMAVAAQSALPGDTLYPLKRAIENAHAGVQSGADAKGNTMLDSASGRLAEIDELTRANKQDARVIAETLDDFVQQASEASDFLMEDFTATGHARSIEELRAFTATSIKSLQELQGVIPEEIRGTLLNATQVVHQIDEQARKLCPACSSLPLTAVPLVATKAIAPLLVDLPKVGSPGDKAKPGSGPKKPQGPSTPVGQPSAPIENPPPVKPSGPASTDPEQPVAPGTPNDHDNHPGKGPHNPLTTITTDIGNSDDPVGDLISGVGGLLGGVIKGGSKP